MREEHSGNHDANGEEIYDTNYHHRDDDISETNLYIRKASSCQCFKVIDRILDVDIIVAMPINCDYHNIYIHTIDNSIHSSSVHIRFDLIHSFYQ